MKRTSKTECLFVFLYFVQKEGKKEWNVAKDSKKQEIEEIFQPETVWQRIDAAALQLAPSLQSARDTLACAVQSSDCNIGSTSL
jgi:hypothetical protein